MGCGSSHNTNVFPQNVVSATLQGQAQNPTTYPHKQQVVAGGEPQPRIHNQPSGYQTQIAFVGPGDQWGMVQSQSVTNAGGVTSQVTAQQTMVIGPQHYGRDCTWKF